MDASGVPSLGQRSGEPVLLIATAGRATGLRAEAAYGASLLIRDEASPASPQLEFRCETRAGPHEIWIEYASYEPRPMAFLIDGRQVRGDVAAETTGGWTEVDASWRFQGTAVLPAGSHALTLRAKGDVPHLRRVALVPVAEPVTPLPDAAAPPGGLLNHHGLVQDEEWFRFLAEVTPAIRRLIARRNPPAAVMAFLRELTGAVARDVRLPHERIGFGGPFNGQQRRQRLFEQLDRLFRFDALVETGAFVGTTTEMFAGLGRPVFACELDPGFHLRAASRLLPCPDVRLFQADSRAFLRHFCTTLSAGFQCPFFYLDAHWRDDLPLAEEVTIIADRFAEFVVFCDDFRHPFHDYGFDSYGPGAELTLECLKPQLARAEAFAFLFPIAPPALESGQRRGTLVIMPKRMYEERLRGRPAAAEFTDSF